MRRIVFAIFILSLLFSLTLTQRVNIPCSKASYAIYQGDLVLTGNTVYMIEGRFDINGSIRVEENATLQLKNAIINFTQTRDFEYEMSFSNPLNGNPRLHATNATITSNYRFLIWFYDNTTATLANCNITESLNAYGDSNVFVSKSVVKRFHAAEYSHACFVDSTIAQDIFLSGYNEVWLINSTYGWHFMPYTAPKIYVAWYLNVRVIDLSDHGVPSANVTVAYQNGTLVDTKFTESTGWTSFALTEKIIDPFGTHLVGNYTATATYEDHERQEAANMTGNKDVTIRLPFTLPEFPSATILSLLMIIMTAVAVFLKKRIGKNIYSPLF